MLSYGPLASDLNPEIEFLNKSIVERVIDSMARALKMRVLAYSTVQRHREEDLDPCIAGRDLAVDVVTAGEIVRRNDHLHLHLELIDCSEGTQLWGAQFKEAYGDVLARPEDLADKISHQLLRILSPNQDLRESKRSEHAA